MKSTAERNVVSEVPTHDELVEIAARWLWEEAGCNVVLKEFPGKHGETPDAIGWCGGDQMSYVIECKANKADFQNDARKISRTNHHRATGVKRYFLAPDSLLGEDEMPPMWGLLSVRGDGTVRHVRPSGTFAHRDSSALNELWMLVEVLGQFNRERFRQVSGRLSRVKTGPGIAREKVLAEYMKLVETEVKTHGPYKASTLVNVLGPGPFDNNIEARKAIAEAWKNGDLKVDRVATDPVEYA